MSKVIKERPTQSIGAKRFVILVTVITLSVTVFKEGQGSAKAQQNVPQINTAISERSDRYPVVDSDEIEPSDAVKKAKLKKQKQQYDKDSPFTQPGSLDREVAFLPERQFDFPAFPAAKSDVIVIGEVLNAVAHRSENKTNVFSNFEVRVTEVLKGSSLITSNVINVQRLGGFVKYPDGRKVLFRLVGNGMPAVGARYAFFLNVLDEDYRILTAYELGPEGVMPLDHADQFRVHQGQKETDFLEALRNTVFQSRLPTPDSPYVKVFVTKSGKITVDGKPTDLAELSDVLAALAQKKGIVLYTRESPEKEPHPIVMQVHSLIIQNRLPVRLCIRKDCSDALNENGKLKLKSLKE